MSQVSEKTAEALERAERSQTYEKVVCPHCGHLCLRVVLRTVRISAFLIREDHTFRLEETPDPVDVGLPDCYSGCCGALLPAADRDRFLALRRD